MQKIRRAKVNQAIELLWINRKEELKGKIKIEKMEKVKHVCSQCNGTHYHRRREKQLAVGFSSHTILSYIKTHANKRNWNKVKNLLLLLIHFSTDIEPLVWRYSFILTLYSNIDNLFNIVQFFKLCIGSLNSDTNLILKNLLLLQHNK
ncbi:hypothetical protein ANTPLA_LOCUS7886 [Anthophora plagiata]